MIVKIDLGPPGEQDYTFHIEVTGSSCMADRLLMALPEMIEKFKAEVAEQKRQGRIKPCGCNDAQ